MTGLPGQLVFQDTSFQTGCPDPQDSGAQGLGGGSEQGAVGRLPSAQVSAGWPQTPPAPGSACGFSERTPRRFFLLFRGQQPPRWAHPLPSIQLRLLATRGHTGATDGPQQLSPSLGPSGQRLWMEGARQLRGVNVRTSRSLLPHPQTGALHAVLGVRFLILPGGLTACLGTGTIEAERKCAKFLVCWGFCSASVPRLVPWAGGEVRGLRAGSGHSETHGLAPCPPGPSSLPGDPQSPQGGVPLSPALGGHSEGDVFQPTENRSDIKRRY